MKEFVLNQTYAKVLLTISELNKNSYYPLTYGNKVMNSLLDIVKDSFVELNK